MADALEPVHPITLGEIREARDRIAGTVIRTPLIRLELGRGFPDIRLKLENLQPTNSYKLRGAVNAVALLSESERKRGVWTISAGNAGQGIAYAARSLGVPCTVVVIKTAPAAKIERMKALGATLVPVPYEVAWKALGERTYAGVDGTFVHPFDDHNFIAGHATMALEILETAAPAALSFARGSPQRFDDWKASFVDGAGGQSLFPRMWERMQGVVDGSVIVSLEETRSAMRLMAEKVRVVAEGAGALPLAAALSGRAGAGPIVAVVSGGNVDLPKFCSIICPADGNA
jgi:threonine dehydratase